MHLKGQSFSERMLMEESSEEEKIVRRDVERMALCNNCFYFYFTSHIPPPPRSILGTGNEKRKESVCKIFTKTMPLHQRSKTAVASRPNANGCTVRARCIYHPCAVIVPPLHAEYVYVWRSASATTDPAVECLHIRLVMLVFDGCSVDGERVDGGGSAFRALRAWCIRRKTALQGGVWGERRTARCLGGWK